VGVSASRAATLESAARLRGRVLGIRAAFGSFARARAFASASVTGPVSFVPVLPPDLRLVVRRAASLVFRRLPESAIKFPLRSVTAGSRFAPRAVCSRRRTRCISPACRRIVRVPCHRMSPFLAPQYEAPFRRLKPHACRSLLLPAPNDPRATAPIRSSTRCGPLLPTISPYRFDSR
jgi:hypothetical protein